MNAEQRAEALRLAEQLEAAAKIHKNAGFRKTSALLRTLAAEPQGELVGWAVRIANKYGGGYHLSPRPIPVADAVPVYLHDSPTRTPLTDGQIAQIWFDNGHGVIPFARAIERKILEG